MQKVLLIGKTVKMHYTAEPVELRRQLYKLIWLLYYIGILTDD
jgi:hypothetical protein